MNIKNNGFLSNMFKVKFISNVPMSVTCTWCWHSNTHQRWVDWSACTYILYSKIYQDRENIKGIGRTVSLSLNFWRYNKSLFFFWFFFRPYIKVINLQKSSIVSNICPWYSHYPYYEGDNDIVIVWLHCNNFFLLYKSADSKLFSYKQVADISSRSGWNQKSC